MKPHTTASKNKPRVMDVIQSELLEEHYPLVNTVVKSMLSYLPRCADFEELHSVGLTGLIAAVQKFDPEQSGTFKAYASLRIRGAILDELRRMDSLPRTRRAKVRELGKVVEELEQKLGRAPRDAEIADAMGLTLAELERYQQKARPVVLVSLDGAPGQDDDTDANLHESIPDQNSRPCYEDLEKSEYIDLMADMIAELPDRQKKVLAMYYYEGMRLAEIAEIFGVSEARICQIHTQALGILRRNIQRVK
ncbi:FliA/WhiG family RNA polymerase sigma factor [Ruficoccus amylovorans]|uniref:FliA/WhiG family RNA polymerase sigma factor n=1 Tax=Ruficoccus amylovorans TaxID=1804625 RepID=A0A842HFQ1_9BACT|nr:FliA/WhiG family RNA polymerase sigma factor [Ruficoccus amylovorans]MBC2595099.1 FliA/WhiG family RNA polymerase sigma factor [Ruficoccus amylovorans]